MIQLNQDIKASIQAKTNALQAQREEIRAKISSKTHKATDKLNETIVALKAEMQEHNNQVVQAREELETKVQQKMDETVEQIADWREKQEQEKLLKKVKKAQDYADDAIFVAAYSILEAESAIVEALHVTAEAEEALGDKIEC